MQLHIAEAHFHVTLPHGERVISDLMRALDTSRRAVAVPPAPPHAAAVVLGQRWQGQGGILVATLPALLGMPARHLIAADSETQLAWGSYEIDETNAVSPVDGAKNTTALMTSRHEHPAAVHCAKFQADGHEDFYLPSRLELLFAYYMAPAAFNTEGWYWTSTQASRNCAFVQDFACGSSSWDAKGLKWRVRPFRQILVIA